MYLSIKKIFSHFLKQPNSLNLNRRALKLGLQTHSQHQNSKMDLLAQNNFVHFSEQHNYLNLTLRALKLGLQTHSQHQNSKMDLLAQSIFCHFLKQPNSLNLTQTALNLALQTLLTAVKLKSGFVGTNYFWPFFGATLLPQFNPQSS